ncbi:MAG TPA: hypothetical protein VNI84_18090 [Pyrinomonadaceae bacterium]|nr:hypothetical protein [Pyrinomonadaceae bacterium]
MKAKMRNLKPTITAIAVIVFGFAGVFLLSGFVEKNRPAPPAGIEDEDLALQGARLKGFSLGFEGLIADWYWMRALQYIGAKVVKDRETNTKFNLENLNGLNPRLLYPLLDNAATLDPRFTAVYSYGAVVLPAIDPQQAVKLTEKGIENNPDEWRLYGQLGYIYWRLNDYARAAEIYEEGAKISGAPTFMTIMASKMKSAGGMRETARAIYEQMLAESPDRQVRDNAALHLLELDSRDERDAILVALKNFKEKNNRCANNWREILPLLQTVKLPRGKNFRVDAANNLVDPSGAPYILDKAVCDVRLDEKTTKIPFK